jgi:hypothetical protein
MKRKLTLGSGVGEDVVPEWSTARTGLRRGLAWKIPVVTVVVVRDLGDEAHTLWLL